MSLSETAQIYEYLVKIDALLSNIQVKTEKIERDMPQTRASLETFKEIERLALRWLVLARRMGLPEEINNAISLITRLISSIRMLQISLNLLMATNPLTMAIGIAGLIGSAYTMADTFAGY